MKNCLRIPRMLLPREGFDKWAVIACDQFTQDRAYWERVARTVADAPSTLRFILPEVYLGEEDEEARISAVRKCMYDALESDVLTKLTRGLVFCERTTRTGVRRGILCCIDLEEFSSEEGVPALIRSSEEVLPARLAPRLAERENVPLEFPHAILFYRDKKDRAVKILLREELEQLYDFDLMEGGGHLTGWFVPEDLAAETAQLLHAKGEPVFAVADEPGEDLSGDRSLGKVRGDICFEDVTFSYSPEKKLIEHLNVEVKAGSKVAIVGPTGCGKTTLINLLMRFYQLRGGRITVDGVDVREIPLDEYRRLFGMVLQESFLAQETVAWNIAYGNEDASRAQVEAAAKAAYCDYFIRNLPDGYDTVLTGSVSISQGERQLLCIARVMLADPPMLILDEATSNIDTMTEMRIQKAFRKMMRGRTSFIVAHRLSTILDADLILVMNAGSVIEQGTHAQLMEKRGFYYDLYNAQFAQ